MQLETIDVRQFILTRLFLVSVGDVLNEARRLHGI